MQNLQIPENVESFLAILLRYTSLQCMVELWSRILSVILLGISND